MTNTSTSTISRTNIDPMAPEFHAITRVRRETRDVFTLEFEPPRPDGFVFLPGQFNMLYAFGMGESAISISGDPARPEKLVHTIRAVGTVTRALQQLRKGDVVGIRGPFGRAWPMAEAQNKDLVIIAGGIGLAPLRPVIYHAVRRRESFGKVVIVYGSRSPADLLFTKEIETWRKKLDVEIEVTVDAADRTWKGHTGVVTKYLGKTDFDPANAIAMMCGPEIMMRFAARELERLGMPTPSIWVTMERNMRCGAALCGHCQFGPSFICREGPVYRYDEVSRLLCVREV
ncbi:MAG TPA: FAD/NAD(P)-binding protein [Polyangium sp.]|jgi:NAD(P)H-flavin reductase|nr:FAD/NAD(P)-binding protein [Polyangium sp.]